MYYHDNEARKAREKNNLESLLETISSKSKRRSRSTLLHRFLKHASHWISCATERKKCFRVITVLRPKITKAWKNRNDFSTKERRPETLNISKYPSWTKLRHNREETRREMKIAIVKAFDKIDQDFTCFNFKIAWVQVGLKAVGKSCSSVCALPGIENN